MKHRRSLGSLALLVSLVCPLALSGCGRDEPPAETTPPQVVLGPADTAIAFQGQITTGPALSGTLTAEAEATVRAQVGGTVLATYARPGERVRRGERLARLDTASLEEAVRSARLAVTNAQSQLALAEREEERQRALVAAGAVARRNVETAEQQTVTARAALGQARSQLAAAQEQLGRTTIDAPIAGVVSEQQVSVGDVVQPGAALYTVIDPSSLELEASIPAERLGQLEIGAPVLFTVNGLPDRTFRGRVTRINPSVDPATRQVRIYAEIPNPEGELVAGLFAEGRVATASRTGLIVPTGAIDRSLREPAVLAVRGGVVQRVPVVLGLRDEEEQQVEIRRGLEPGDVVLLGAAQEITPGTPVRLAPAIREAAERLAVSL